MIIRSKQLEYYYKNKDKVQQRTKDYFKNIMKIIKTILKRYTKIKKSTEILS